MKLISCRGDSIARAGRLVGEHPLRHSRMLMAAMTFLALAFATGGCGQRAPRWEHARSHVIAVDSRGYSVDPANWPHRLKPEQYRAHLDGLVAHMHEYFETREPEEPWRILIYVHGGMVKPASALKRARELTPKMTEDGYFPIFVVWNPELWSSYGEQLIWVRRGHYDPRGWWQTPFYLFADLGRGVTRAPVVWQHQIDNDLDRLRGNLSAAIHDDPELISLANPKFRAAHQVSRLLVRRYYEDDVLEPPRDSEIAISPGVVRRRDHGISTIGWLTYLISAPAKLLSSPLLDAGGKAAWDNMYRRAHVLFDGTAAEELEERAIHGEAIDPVRLVDHGLSPLEDLIKELAELAPAHEGKLGVRNIEITLVGHSMGSIVVNEMLRRSKDVEYRNIVYMGAACSVRDFQRAVVPYMLEHNRTKFYNLTLHPANELRESNGYEVPPRGSLLVWIDDMFQSPNSHIDRTLGRWENIVHAAYVIPPEIRAGVHWKAFDMYRDARLRPYNPQKHGQFDDPRFWDPYYWLPQPPDEASRRMQALQSKTRR